MDFFTFILILVGIISVTEMVTKIFAPVARRLSSHLAESAAEKRRARTADPAELPADLVRELEHRLSSIEERLDFLEELKSPRTSPRLGAGSEPER